MNDLKPLKLAAHEKKHIADILALGKDGNEHLRIIIGDEEYVTLTDGSTNSVVIPENIWEHISRQPTGSVELIHNHPHSSPPSIDDLVALTLDAVKCTIIVGHNGFSYKVSIENGIMPTENELNDWIDEFMRDVKNEIVFPGLADGTIKRTAVPMIIDREVMMRVIRLYEWELTGGKSDD